MSLIHGNNIPPINLNQEPIPTYKIQWSSPSGKSYTIEQLKSHFEKSSSEGKKTDVDVTFQKINALADALFREAAEMSSLGTSADNVSFNKEGHTAHSISGGDKTVDYKKLKESDTTKKVEAAVVSILAHKAELVEALEEVVSRFEAEGDKGPLGKSMSAVEEGGPLVSDEESSLNLSKVSVKKTDKKRKNPEQSSLFDQYKRKIKKIHREITIERRQGIEQETSKAFKKFKKLETELSLPEGKFSSDETKEIERLISAIKNLTPLDPSPDSYDSATGSSDYNTDY